MQFSKYTKRRFKIDMQRLWFFVLPRTLLKLRNRKNVIKVLFSQKCLKILPLFFVLWRVANSSYVTQDSKIVINFLYYPFPLWKWTQTSPLWKSLEGFKFRPMKCVKCFVLFKKYLKQFSHIFLGKIPEIVSTWIILIHQH